MRFALLACAAIVLTACDSGTVPNPAGGGGGDAASRSSVQTNQVDLRRDGLAAGAEAFYFAAGKSEVEAALARALGEASGNSTNAECGAGPVEFTDYPGGLAVHFQQGRLVGWNWRALQDGDAPAKGTIKLADGPVGVGTARSEAAQTSGFALIPGSTLGEEFSLGTSIGGFIEGERVTMLYAGTQCFFR